MMATCLLLGDRRPELGGHPMTLRPPSSADPSNSCSPSPTRTGHGTGPLPTQSSGVSANLSFSPLILTENSQRSNAETPGREGPVVRGRPGAHPECLPGALHCLERKTIPSTTPSVAPPTAPLAHNTRGCVGGAPEGTTCPRGISSNTPSNLGSWDRGRTGRTCLVL